MSELGSLLLFGTGGAAILATIKWTTLGRRVRPTTNRALVLRSARKEPRRWRVAGSTKPA
jgi:hypothetical protein